MSVVTITPNPCIDKTFSVERIVPDRKLVARDVHAYPGGGGVNVARVVHRLGGDARALWTCGGSTGELLGRLLDAEGVAHAPLRIRQSVRENLIALDVSTCQQYRFGMPGPVLTADERGAWIEHARAHVSGPGFTVLSGSISRGVPRGWYRELVASAGRSRQVIVDTKQDALAEALEVGVYLIKPNLHELEEIVGRALEEDDEIERAAREIVERGAAEVVLVSLGRGGALLVTSGRAQRFFAPAVPLRSKVGAGDSLVGGLVLGLSQGLSLSQSARLGVAAGAAAVMTEGTELCRREDTERLVSRVRRVEVDA